MARREVDTTRPEHSWIPFYRELAEKLVNGGWRDKQPKLVRMLKEMETEELRMPGVLNYLDQFVDPFTLIAIISRDMSWMNLKPVIEGYKTKFSIDASVPKEQPFVPPPYAQKLGFFPKDGDTKSEVDDLWDLFEFALNMDPVSDVSRINELIELIDKCIRITGVKLPKLSSGLYWINPENFLKNDTINSIVINANLGDRSNGKEYVEGLLGVHEIERRSFPEINVAVDRFKKSHRNSPKVWLIRGGRDGIGIADFLAGNYSGIGFMKNIDLSKLLKNAEIEAKYIKERGEITNNAPRQIDTFINNIRINDYVIMPTKGGKGAYFGLVSSDPYHVKDDSEKDFRNRRDVIWCSDLMTQDELPDLPPRSISVHVANQSLTTQFFTALGRKDWKPELAIGEKGSMKDRSGFQSYTIDDMLNDGLFFERDELQRIIDRFEDKKNLILQGPPGVGKTFVSKRLAYALMSERADDRIRNVQFHQSYSYEEFVQGYRPATNPAQQLIFKREDGVFLKLCEEASREENRGKDYVMVIDEINRGNLSRVFGELLSMIEKDKRGGRSIVELQSGVRLSVPDNVYILGTMNLADRSLAGMDYAMRRRFAFVTLEPQFGESVFEDWLRERDVPDTMIDRINDRMSELNDKIAGDASLGRNFAVGHSYFCDLDSRLRGNDAEGWDRWYRNIVETELQPLLEEYWFDDLGKADGEVRKLLEGVARDGDNNDN